MPDPDAPARRPTRLRRGTPDLRLVLGVLLVVGSVAAVYGVVAAADRRVTVYAAAAALAPGERIDAGDLVRRSVALDGSERFYLAVGDLPSEGLVVTQPVAKGQLLPTSAVGSRAGVSSTSLVLQLATRVSGAVVPGASIDIWAASDPDGTAAVNRADAAADPVSGAVASGGDDAAPIDPAAPSVLVAGAIVVKVLDDSNGFSVSNAGSSIEVLVPRTRVARLLEAIAKKASLAVVPAGIPIAVGASAGVGS